MRAVFGSLRLTKVIDFDRQPNLSRDSLKAGLPKALIRAAANAGIKQPDAEITKLTQTTVPYLPENVCKSITEHQWLEYTLTVGTSIERWCDEAIRVMRNGSQS